MSVVMASFSHKEVLNFNQAVRHVRAVRSAEGFSDHLLRALRSIISGDICVVDWNGRKGLEVKTAYDPIGSIPKEVNEAVHRYLHENPLYGRRHHEACSISDCLNVSQWERTALYQEAYRKMGQRDGLAIDLDFADGRRLSLNITRSKRGFTQGERLALTLLRHHVEDVYFSLKAIERSRVEWIGVNNDGVIFANREQAQGLFARLNLRYAPSATRLPSPLCDWFRDCFRQWYAGRIPQRSTYDFGHTLVRFAPSEISSDEGFLLFEPRAGTLGPELSMREREVLAWLTEGKTNAEIATLLDISQGTVKRHLENLYAKIGVENRHAACQWALRRAKT